MLAGGVNAEARETHAPRHRRGVHDGAAAVLQQGGNFVFQIKLIYLIDFYHSLKMSARSVDNLEEYDIGINTRLTLWEAEI